MRVSSFYLQVEPKKAKIIKMALEGCLTSQVTASAIQIYAGEATVVLDEDAASNLSNVEHIKHTESISNKYKVRAE